MRLAVKLALGLAAIIGAAQAAETLDRAEGGLSVHVRSGQLTHAGTSVVAGDKIKALGVQTAPPR